MLESVQDMAKIDFCTRRPMLTVIAGILCIYAGVRLWFPWAVWVAVGALFAAFGQTMQASANNQ